MATIYIVQAHSDDGGTLGGVFSSYDKAATWIEEQSDADGQDWCVKAAAMDMPWERNDEKILTNLESKGHSFVFDPYHRCIRCGDLIGPLQDREEEAKLSEPYVPAPACQPK